MEVSESERKECISRCVEFLAGIWTKVKQEQIECQRITSGVANKTFRVSIKDCKLIENNNEVENSDVIVRIYNSGVFGSEHKIKFNGEVGEVMILQRLHFAGLAPKLLGVFDGGRIEEYIPSRPTTVEDLKSIELSKEVIRKLAKYHTLSMPVSKKPNLVEHMAAIVKRAKLTPEILDKFATQKEECKMIMNFPFEEELVWIRKILPIVGHKIVFSHNDMNPNNILLKDKPNSSNDRIVLIDYEMSTYFYRAHDLAYFLFMKRAKIEMQADKVVFDVEEEDDFATDALLQEYLNEYRKVSNDRIDPKYDNLDRFRMEVEFFGIVVYCLLLGMSKAVIFDSVVAIPLNMAVKMVSNLKEKKQKVIDKYGDPLLWKQ